MRSSGAHLKKASRDPCRRNRAERFFVGTTQSRSGFTLIELILVMALLGPKVGPIGVGTFIALVVAVLATRSALHGHRDKRLR